MATYNKRGHKSQSKEEKQQSTTAEVFSNLDEGASKMENWVQKHNKVIFGTIFGVIALGLGYLLYNNYISNPEEIRAQKELYFARNFYQKALDGSTVQKDSLYRVALNGDGDRYGLLDIISQYGGTNAENEAHYLSGMAFLQLQDNDQAITHLKSISTDDPIIKPLYLGGIADAYADRGDTKQALAYYQKAIKVNKNNYTTPRFLLKAARVALKSGETSLANQYLRQIKNEYSGFSNSNAIEALLAKVKTESTNQ